MHELVSRLRSSVRDIDDVLGNLDDSLATLSQEWTGRASESYHAAQRAWRARLAEMLALLESYERRAESNREMFEQSSNRIERIWS